MSKVLDTVLLFALPASGKSEVRAYLRSLSEDQCRNEMHLGPTLQLDDYPYVHLMHRIDDELKARGQDYVFYHGPTRPFKDCFTWGVLIELLNEDYADLLASRTFDVPSAAQLLFDRIDNAREKVGLERVLDDIPYRVRMEMGEALEEECAAELKAKNETCSQDHTGKTIVIEAARGGANGATFPLTPARGYQYTLSVLSKEILDRAGILYVWVTPEESRRKNIERGKPDGQGSILFHSVPMEVMLGEYGCDDMAYLIEQSDKPDTVKVERAEAEDGKYTMKTWNIPVARFDNRDDLTTFVRKDKADWQPEEIKPLHDGLGEALGILAKRMEDK